MSAPKPADRLFPTDFRLMLDVVLTEET